MLTPRDKPMIFLIKEPDLARVLLEDAGDHEFGELFVRHILLDRTQQATLTDFSILRRARELLDSYGNMWTPTLSALSAIQSNDVAAFQSISTGPQPLDPCLKEACVDLSQPSWEPAWRHM